MRINYKIVFLFATMGCGVLLGCDPVKPSYQAPDFHPSPITIEIPDVLGQFFTCDKPEAELPHKEEASKNKISVQGEMKIQNSETKDCDGKVTKTGEIAVEDMLQQVTIPADSSYGDQLTSVSIENFRTCKKATISASADKLGPKTMQDPEGKTFELPVTDSQATRAGDLELVLTSSTFKITDKINVNNGQNILQITYLGKCLKFDDAKETKDQKCIEAEVLGQKFVQVDVALKSTKVPGVSTIDDCEKKKTDDSKEEAP